MITLKATVDIRDLDELTKNLSPAQIQKVMARAIKVAIQPTVKLAKRLAPRETGALRRSIKAKIKSRRGSTTVSVVGARHAHLVEYGHRQVVDGKVVGLVPAYPFTRPALAVTQPEMEAAVTRDIEASIGITGFTVIRAPGGALTRITRAV